MRIHPSEMYSHSSRCNSSNKNTSKWYGAEKNLIYRVCHIWKCKKLELNFLGITFLKVGRGGIQQFLFLKIDTIMIVIF
jgi:hypothetical protein